MNKDFIVNSLVELKEHIDVTIVDIKDGRYDEDGDLSLPVRLEHFVEHIILCWHYRNMTWDEISDQTQETYEALSYSIPRFHENYKVVDLED